MFETNTLLLVLVVVVAVVGLLVLRKSGNKHEKELLLRCRNDREQANRLIALEQKRNPELSRNSAAQAALRSLRRDNQ